MNKVILMGRLTADPELRYTTGSNIPVCASGSQWIARFKDRARSDRQIFSALLPGEARQNL